MLPWTRSARVALPWACAGPAMIIQPSKTRKNLCIDGTSAARNEQAPAVHCPCARRRCQEEIASRAGGTVFALTISVPFCAFPAFPFPSGGLSARFSRMLATEVHAVDERISSYATQPTNSDRVDILIADDEPIVRRLLEMALAASTWPACRHDGQWRGGGTRVSAAPGQRWPGAAGCADAGIDGTPGVPGVACDRAGGPRPVHERQQQAQARSTSC